MRPRPAIEKVKRLGVDVHRQCEILCGAHDTQGLFDLERHMVSTSWRPAENHRRRLTLYSAVPRYWNGSYFGEAQGAAVLIETESARVNLADCRFDFFLNFGGFTLSGRLPVMESNQFWYAVSKALPVC